MSPNLQVKLLRVLQDRSFEPVGSSKSIRVDVRIIAATNQNLAERIKQNTFREDLFYRLNVLPIEIPPLRNRTEDIPLLVHHFLDAAKIEKNSTVELITDEAMQCLVEYHWPGNVRELQNLIERLVILTPGTEIDACDLPPQFQEKRPQLPDSPRIPAAGLDFNHTVEQLEVDLILQALERTHWNKNRAAQLLGLNRTTLEGKIRKRGRGRSGSEDSSRAADPHLCSGCGLGMTANGGIGASSPTLRTVHVTRTTIS